MQKIKYISNRELLVEIQRSKATYCHFISPDYALYDVIVANIDDLTPEVILAALQIKILRLAKLQIELVVTADDLVFRVMSDLHLPPEEDEKRRKKSRSGQWIVKTNFPPFQHFIVRDGKPVEVGRSHWHGSLDDGGFSLMHGRITDRLASMFMLMVERYSRGGSWRGYCVDQETEALTQRGWLTMHDITEDDIILSYDDGKLKWSAIKSIFRDDFDGKMFRLTVAGLDALVTPRHKFVTDKGLKEVELLSETDRIVLTEEASVSVSQIDFHGAKGNPNQPTIDYQGKVWCPETEFGSFMARRNGCVYLTGNTYNDEMRSHALVQLSQVGLQFDESRSDNPFAFYTQITKNCFAGDTSILTLEHGFIAIGEVSEQDVHLLDGNGNWVLCHIYDHGIQETVNLNFFGGYEKVSIRSTMEHDWIQQGTKERIPTSAFVEGNGYPTKQLWIDDLRPAKTVKDDIEYRRGVIHGIIYGDGSSIGATYYKVRLCSEKAELSPWFNGYPRTNPPSNNGDPSFFMSNAWCDLKAFPEKPGQSLDYLLGFLRGWMATDGCVSNEGRESVATLCTDEAEYNWIKKWGCLVGWQVRGFTVLPGTTNYGVRNKRSLNIHLKKHSMDVEDFLRDKHRNRWEQTIPHVKGWRVYPGKRQSFERRIERVYCPVVPTTHSFALGHYVHVSNCFRRVLNLERRNQDIRDDLLIMSGAQPSYTRQIDNEFDQRDDWQKAEPTVNQTDRKEPKEAPKKRGRKPRLKTE